MKRIAKFGLMIVCITLLLITMTVGISAKSVGISVMVNGAAVKFLIRSLWFRMSAH